LQQIEPKAARRATAQHLMVRGLIDRGGAAGARGLMGQGRAVLA